MVTYHVRLPDRCKVSFFGGQAFVWTSWFLAARVSQFFTRRHAFNKS